MFGLKALTLALLFGLGQADSNVQLGKFDVGNYPGMIMRIDESNVNQMKRALQEFLPHYLDVDYRMPETYHYKVQALADFIGGELRFDKINLVHPDLNLDDLNFSFTTHEKADCILVKVPTIKNLKLTSEFSIHIFGFEIFKDNFSLDLKDLKTKFKLALRVPKPGKLDVVVNTFDINLGSSDIVAENWFVEIFVEQTLYLMLCMLEVTSDIMGDLIFSKEFGPYADYIFNDYIINYQVEDFLPIRGGQKEWFAIDLRQMQEPVITDGQMDLFFNGETFRNSLGCELNQKEKLEFFPPKNGSISQLVLSETAVNCALNQYAQSNLGIIEMSKDNINWFWNSTNLSFNSTEIQKFFPIFQEKLGPNKPLRFLFKPKNINVHFAVGDADVAIEYTLCISWNQYAKDSPELLYDEIQMISTAKLSQQKDRLYIELLTNKLNLDSKLRQSDLPKVNGMKLVAEEYREFISSFGGWMAYMRKFMNFAVFKKGIKLPFASEELKTFLQFQKGSVAVFYQLQDGSAQILEKKYWDQDEQKKKGLIK